jgi:hypothetical protein
VTVVDTTPPIFTCSADKVVTCGTPWVFDPPADAVDEASGTNVSVEAVSTVTNTSAICVGAFIVMKTWSATDLCGNSNLCSQSVTVLEPNASLFTCVSNKTVEFGEPWDFDAPALPSVPCAGQGLSIGIMDTQTNLSVACQRLLTTTRSWMIMNQCGVGSVCSQTVSVVDTTPPTMVCADQESCDPAFSIKIDAQDNCDPNPSVLCQREDGHELAEPFAAGVTIVTCTATDCSTNSTSCTFKVTIKDCVEPSPR